MTPVALHEARALWRRARTFEELCALGARFVAGELPLFPGWGAPALDDESDPLTRDLEALNRSGLLTVASQPGRREGRGRDGRVRAQRAFVCGFARRATALRIASAARESGLAVAVFPPGASGGRRVAVSVHAGRPCVFTGHDARRAEMRCFAPHLGPRGLAALSRACWVSVHDPVWGRRPHLWTHLCAGCRARAR